MHFAPPKQTKTTPQASSQASTFSAVTYTNSSQPTMGNTTAQPVQRKAAPARLFDDNGRLCHPSPEQQYKEAIQRIEGKSSASRFPAHSIHQTASQGVQGRGQRIPYYQKIQAAFGKHDISHVQAYTGSQAQSASKAIGAEAYATGNRVAFANPNPSLHTVAHETAHVIQQQAGVQLKGGVGEAGDSYERQADQVADAVVKGSSAESLLNLNSNGALGYSSSTMQPIQRKLIINNTIPTTTAATVPATTVTTVPLPPITTIDKTNVVTEAGSYAEAFSKRPEIIKNEISKASIERYLKEFVEITDDKETFQFEDTKLEEYIISRHLKGNMFKDLDDELKYITFKTYITGKKGYYKYSRTGFREALFDPTYLYPDYETSKSISPILTANLMKPVVAGGYTAEGFGKPPLRTKIVWSKETNHMGVKMTADPLGPDHPQGQDTSKTDPESEKAREDFDILTGNGNKSGHLLNDQLGGPARVYNLAPITTSANRLHETRAEDPVKELVHDHHTWVWYEVEMHQNDMDATRFATLYGTINATTATRPTTADDRKKATPAQKKQAAEALDKKYVDKLTVNWGQVDNNGIHTGSTHGVTLDIEDPLKAKYSPTAIPNLKKKPSNPAPLGHRSTLKPYNFTLEKEPSTIALIETITKFLKDFTDAKLDAISLKQNLAELESVLKTKIIAKIDDKMKEVRTASGLKELYDVSKEGEFYNTAVKLFSANEAEATEYDNDDVKLSSQVKKQQETFKQLSTDILNFNIADFAKRFATKYKTEIFKEYNGDISNDKGKEVFDMFFENYTKEASKDTQAKKLHELNMKTIEEWKNSTEKFEEKISEHKRKLDEVQDESTIQRRIDLLENLKSNKENFNVSFDNNANKLAIAKLEELSYSEQALKDMYNEDLNAEGGLNKTIEKLQADLKNKKPKTENDTPMNNGI
jgi:hypothetical protein